MTRSHPKISCAFQRTLATSLASYFLQDGGEGEPSAGRPSIFCSYLRSRGSRPSHSRVEDQHNGIREEVHNRHQQSSRQSDTDDQCCVKFLYRSDEVSAETLHRENELDNNNAGKQGRE